MEITRVELTEFRAAIESDPPPAVLCGAGVSMIAPTRLPSGDELRDLCVRGLLTDEVSAPVVDELFATPAYRRLLPEIAFQDVAAAAAEALDRAMARVLGRARHNRVHAHLAAHFPDLFTTNFELCLENAGAARVEHLHGTIARPESLQNQIFRLGKTADREFARFREAAVARPLLVLGYSFRDRDILDLVRETGVSAVLYLSYDGAVPATAAETGAPWTVAAGSAEALFGITGPPPAAGETAPVRFPPPSRAARANALLRLCFTVGRYDLGEAVTRRYLPSLRGRARLKALAELANLHRVAGDVERSREVTREILRNRAVLRPGNADIRSSAHVHLGLADLDEKRGNYAEIEANFRAALRDAETFAATMGAGRWRTELEIWQARIYNNLGITYSEWGRYADALALYRRSRAIKLRHHEEVGTANTMGNVAKLFLRTGRYPGVIRALHSVVAIMRRLPDPYVLHDTLATVPPFLEQSRGVKVNWDTGEVREGPTSVGPLSRAEEAQIARIAALWRELQTIEAELLHGGL